LSFRQSNIKYKELKLIDDKFVLIQDVGNHLIALNILYSGHKLKNKVDVLLDRMITSYLYTNYHPKETTSIEDIQLNSKDINTISNTLSKVSTL
jgi:hypothetical protein